MSDRYRRDDDHPINDEDEKPVLNQQVMCDLQQVVVALLARNPNHDGRGGRDNKNVREPPLRGYNNRNRPPAYDEDDSEDDEYEEHVHGGYRGPVRELARDNQQYCMKMELPSFKGDVTIEDFLISH
ncbi:hypothetical protein SO802_001927 [Lithocarpus litseifolius]|uniref:Uncharacterized protein n=1 Tax=Lithocarpus litseifolius TaxID=425828 RepID=A0AAW2DZB7_9ROSI